jgi:hypothetical protein
MGVSFRRFGDLLVEVAEDRLFAENRLAVGESEGRDGVRAGCLGQFDPTLLVGWDLADEIVDAELGQPLPNPS